jgi:putative sporulation protein YtxC
MDLTEERVVAFTGGIDGILKRLENACPVRVKLLERGQSRLIFEKAPNAAACAVFARHIADRFEKSFLDRTLAREYPEMAKYERREALERLADFEGDASLGAARRLEALRGSLQHYFAENKFMNFQGFCAFRTGEYQEILRRVADELASDYYTRREYDEYIGLLRYFVQTTGDRPETASVIVCENGKYQIFDEEENDITMVCFEDFREEIDEAEILFDDLLLSVLVTLAPRAITVYGRENIKNRELFATLGAVFGRVSYGRRETGDKL